MTRAEIIYQRRIAVLDHAARVGNVAEACRVFGISRTRYYEWKGVADRYGLDALMPKERRAPQMPEATPTHVIEALLTLAVTEPTIGCRQYADRLGDQGFSIAKSTVQKHLVAHGLGKRSQRLARAAAIAAATTGLVTEAARKDEPFGFCLATRRPGRARLRGQLLRRQAQGRGQGVPAHRHRRLHPLGLRRHRARPGPTAPTTMRFIDQVLRAYRRHGVRVRAVLSDNGPEYVAGAFRAHLAAKGLRTSASRPARPTTTRCASASTAPSSKSAGARPSIAVTSPRSASSRPKPTPGSSPTTTAGATTATTCAGRTPHQILDNHKKNKAA